MLLRLFMAIISVWWKYHLMACYCTPPLSLMFSDVRLVALN